MFTLTQSRTVFTHNLLFKLSQEINRKTSIQTDTQKFKCKNLLEKTVKYEINKAKCSEGQGCNDKTDVAKCRRACNNTYNCSSYFFDKDENICTRYLSGTENAPTRYCAKTSRILRSTYKYSCVYGSE